jgi:hypothetical protein
VPGDVTAQALVAQRETDQVTVGELAREYLRSIQLRPSAAAELVAAAQQLLSEWDGGLARCDVEASWLAALDGGADVAPGDP